MIKNIIRPIAICLFYNKGKILATVGYDKKTKQKYYRPIGGGIEFGETSQEALVREIIEELNEEVKNLKKLGIIENIFTYCGQAGHEIVFVYDGQFKNKDIYSKKKIIFSDNGEKDEAIWLDLKKIPNKKIPLYPDGLLSLINKKIKNK
jgi:8-oxo-dGTP pyrophosphatase MutT (NUDIX family)